jgi:hypothetical protein
MILGQVSLNPIVKEQALNSIQNNLQFLNRVGWEMSLGACLIV